MNQSQTDSALQLTCLHGLLRDLEIARANGSFRSKLARLGRIGVLLIDDWAMTPMKECKRRDFWEACSDSAESPRICHPWTILVSNIISLNQIAHFTAQASTHVKHLRPWQFWDQGA